MKVKAYAEGIHQNGRKRGQDRPAGPGDEIGQKGGEQSEEASSYNIIDAQAPQDIRHQTSDEQPGYGGRGEVRKYG